MKLNKAIEFSVSHADDLTTPHGFTLVLRAGSSVLYDNKENQLLCGYNLIVSVIRDS